MVPHKEVHTKPLGVFQHHPVFCGKKNEVFFCGKNEAFLGGLKMRLFFLRKKK